MSIIRSNRYMAALLVCVALSFMVHYFATEFLSRKADDIEPPGKPAAITLRIVEAPEKKTPAGKMPTQVHPGPAKKSGSKKVVVVEDAEEDEEDEKQPAAVTSYSQLFPGPAWPSGTIIGSTESAGRGAPPSTTTQKISGHLSGSFDIPLVFRENSATSKAVAKLRLKKDGHWYFEYIDGDPVLRAVLFQAFLKRENLAKVKELAGELVKNELVFVLVQQTKPALDGMKHFSDSISYQGNKISYLRVIFTGDDGSSGMALPDKEAERARLRDQVALKRLMDSPAYFSPIRNRKID